MERFCKALLIQFFKRVTGISSGLEGVFGLILSIALTISGSFKVNKAFRYHGLESFDTHETE